jgi:hypothetical protein
MPTPIISINTCLCGGRAVLSTAKNSAFFVQCTKCNKWADGWPHDAAIKKWNEMMPMRPSKRKRVKK